MHELFGLRVIESLHLEQDGTPYFKRRSWRERLFSRPWRPFLAGRFVVPRIPFKGCVRLDAHTIVVHPATLKALREAAARWTES